MRRYPASAASDTYKLKVQIFENGKLKEFLQMKKDFKTGTKGTGSTSSDGKIQFLRTMLCGKYLREFEIITSQFVSTTNGHLKKPRRVY